MIRPVLSEDGFSLLELLVAMAILSLAIIPMIATQTTALTSTVRLNERALAQIVAENVLTELTISEKAPNPGITSGNEQQAGMDFNWQATVGYLNQQPIASISISVTKQGNRNPLYEITGFRKTS